MPKSVMASLAIAALGSVMGGSLGLFLGYWSSVDNPALNFANATGLVGAISGFLFCFGFSMLFVWLMKRRGSGWRFIIGPILGGVAGAASDFATALPIFPITTIIRSEVWTSTIPGFVIGFITALMLAPIEYYPRHHVTRKG
jgi:hypothetical protein